MTSFTKKDLLQYLQEARLASVSTIGTDGEPQSALVGIGVTVDLQIIFDTVSTSRKHHNLLQDPRIAVMVAGPGEKTLQYQGIAVPVSLDGVEDKKFRDAYYASWPDGVERLSWKGISYWRIVPSWARYSDFDAGPQIVELDFDPHQ